MERKSGKSGGPVDGRWELDWRQQCSIYPQKGARFDVERSESQGIWGFRIGRELLRLLRWPLQLRPYMQCAMQWLSASSPNINAMQARS
jgi:hypothetical protein